MQEVAIKGDQRALGLSRSKLISVVKGDSQFGVADRKELLSSVGIRLSWNEDSRLHHSESSSR